MGWLALLEGALLLFGVLDRLIQQAKMRSAAEQAAQAAQAAHAWLAKAQSLQDENAELKRQLAVYQGGHPPAMTQALVNAPTIFSEARRQADILTRYGTRANEGTRATPPPADAGVFSGSPPADVGVSGTPALSSKEPSHE